MKHQTAKQLQKRKKEVVAKKQHQSSQPAGQTWLTLTQWKSGSGPAAAADRRPLLFPESMESFSGVWKKVSSRGKSLQCPNRKHFAAAVKLILILAVAPPSLPLQRKLIGPVVFRLAEKTDFVLKRHSNKSLRN